RKMAAHEVAAWLHTLKVRRPDAEAIAAAVTLGPRLAERLRRDRPSAAELVDLLQRYDPDAPLFALALEELPASRDHFARLRGGPEPPLCRRGRASRARDVAAPGPRRPRQKGRRSRRARGRALDGRARTAARRRHGGLPAGRDRPPRRATGDRAAARGLARPA